MLMGALSVAAVQAPRLMMIWCASHRLSMRKLPTAAATSWSLCIPLLRGPQPPLPLRLRLPLWPAFPSVRRRASSSCGIRLCMPQLTLLTSSSSNAILWEFQVRALIVLLARSLSTGAMHKHSMLGIFPCKPYVRVHISFILYIAFPELCQKRYPSMLLFLVFIIAGIAGRLSTNRDAVAKQVKPRTMITLEKTMRPNLAPPFPLNRLLKNQIASQAEDMLRGLVAAAQHHANKTLINRA